LLQAFDFKVSRWLNLSEFSLVQNALETLLIDIIDNSKAIGNESFKRGFNDAMKGIKREAEKLRDKEEKDDIVSAYDNGLYDYGGGGNQYYNAKYKTNG